MSVLLCSVVSFFMSMPVLLIPYLCVRRDEKGKTSLFTHLSYGMGMNVLQRQLFDFPVFKNPSLEKNKKIKEKKRSGEKRVAELEPFFLFCLRHDQVPEIPTAWRPFSTGNKQDMLSVVSGYGWWVDGWKRRDEDELRLVCAVDGAWGQAAVSLVTEFMSCIWESWALIMQR